jgi:hypothetical protein
MTILDKASALAPVTQKRAKLDSGVFVFCGIGLLLALFALMCGWFGIEGAVGL